MRAKNSEILEQEFQIYKNILMDLKRLPRPSDEIRISRTPGRFGPTAFSWRENMKQHHPEMAKKIKELELHMKDCFRKEVRKKYIDASISGMLELRLNIDSDVPRNVDDFLRRENRFKIPTWVMTKRILDDLVREKLETERVDEIISSDEFLFNRLRLLAAIDSKRYLYWKDIDIEFIRRVPGFMNPMIEDLDPDWRRVIELRFPMGKGRPKSLRDVAKELAISESRARRLEESAIRQMKHQKYAELLSMAHR